MEYPLVKETEKKWFELINFYDFASFHRVIDCSVCVYVRKKAMIKSNARLEKWIEKKDH